MILFPNAKINLGLMITGKRPDGYHDISTVMVPIGWCDVLEIVPSRKKETTLTTYGRKVDCPPEKNLVIKAYNSLAEFTGGLPPVEFYLEKIIPDGAGMGGGSADAAFAIKGLNELFNLGLPDDLLAKIALTVGADCPFFIYNRPALCEGIGEEISFDVEPCLNGKSILIAKPHVAAVSTREAYAGVRPTPPKIYLPDIVGRQPSDWKGIVKNDFEPSIFLLLQAVEELKNTILEGGAEYASMTGSGAAVFGIFDNDKMAQSVCDKLADCDKIVTKALYLND